MKKLADASLEFGADAPEVVVVEGLACIAFNQVAEARLDCGHRALGPEEFVVRVKVQRELLWIGDEITVFNPSREEADVARGALEQGLGHGDDVAASAPHERIGSDFRKRSGRLSF